ncbi:hypothetical protein HID58_065973, partial [Brassica napus]
RSHIWTEEAAGFHKRVKRIHDPVKIVVPCTVFEAESPIPPDRSMQFNSYIEVLDDHQHRSHIWTEEAAGFHKRVKRIHDPVKIVVPCTVFEAESPIPPDRSMQFNSYIEVLDDHQH